ncbi:MAG: helix-turn-helix transcriptional regulator [Lachnospiraceae bacterium]|jgi:AcrR family transcriptional regulator|nr:helix-turn-helix transcriptional regulator [Lachnospiraceae bacterium]
MPRDKTQSHARVRKAIKEEFLEKGYEGASIRSIGAKAGMTSAGLYRHYADKADMFSALVDPLIESIENWVERHKSRKYGLMEDGTKGKDLFGETVVDLFKDVIIPQKEEFRLLINCSAGTKYENFIHDFVEKNQIDFMNALVYLRECGYKVKDIDEEEMHMLLSAYITACIEPIVHGYDDKKIDSYMQTIQEFFMPGWYNLMGIK